MSIEKGDFVRVNFVGRIIENDEVFDTTYQEIAQEADIYNENKDYVPIPIVVGGNHLLPQLEEAIVGLDAGDSKTVEVSSDDAFGPRDPKAIKLMSMKEFKKNGMTPYPGMRISWEGGEGKILTVNGGRVKVDFNHPLAGKDLVYDIQVTEIIDDVNEKIKGMIQLHYPNSRYDLDETEIDIEDGVVNIQLDELTRYDQQSHMDINIAKFRISKDIWDNIDGIEKVNFIDSFEKHDDSEEKEEGEE